MKLPYKVKEWKSVQKNFDFLSSKVLEAKGPYTNPGYALATNYQPNKSRPTLVIAVLSISCTGAEGFIDVKVDPFTPPTTIAARHGLRNNNAANVFVFSSVTFIVPASYYFRMDGNTVAGAPAYGVDRSYQLTL